MAISDRSNRRIFEDEIEVFENTNVIQINKVIHF